MRFWILILILTLSACASQKSQGWQSLIDWTGLVDWQKMERSSRWTIDDDARFYVAMPMQEILDENFHARLTTVFSRYYPNTRAAMQRESLQQSFTSAQYAGMDYLIYPQLRDKDEPIRFDFPDKWKEVFDKQTYDVRRGQLDMDILIFVTNDESLVDHLRLETSPKMREQDGSRLLFEKLDDYLNQLSR